MAAIAANGNDKKKERILSEMKNAETTARSFQCVATAIGQMHTGLTQLIVDEQAGSEITLFHKDQIYNRLIDRNQRHYGQANETVFGANGDNAHHIDPSTLTISD